MDGLVIRQLRAEDVPRFFTDGYQALGEKWLGLQEQEEMYVAVAEIDGVPVGRSCLQYHFKADPPNAYSFATSVFPAWQSRGIGSFLVAHNEEVARSRGMYRISAHSGKDNPRSAAWREKMGYQLVAEETIYWDDAGGHHELPSWKFEHTFTPPLSYRVRRWVRKKMSKWRRRLMKFGGRT
jgi:GNAT superfamily N-acetyltransferase